VHSISLSFDCLAVQKSRILHHTDPPAKLSNDLNLAYDCHVEIGKVVRWYPILQVVKIARDWNVPASGAGFVTRFMVRKEFL
jgi:hypothetical protein